MCSPANRSCRLVAAGPHASAWVRLRASSAMAGGKLENKAVRPLPGGRRWSSHSQFPGVGRAGGVAQCRGCRRGAGDGACCCRRGRGDVSLNNSPSARAAITPIQCDRDRCDRSVLTHFHTTSPWLEVTGVLPPVPSPLQDSTTTPG